MTNFLNETVESISDSGHSIEDVVFVGSLDGTYGLDWKQFEALAKDVNYDSSFGSSEIAIDLIVLFSDGKKMWRGEYDGSEWWEYDSPSEVVYDLAKALPIQTLSGSYWPDLEMLHSADTHPMYFGGEG